MYKKLAFLTSLVLLLSLVATSANADDPCAPDWRGRPGTTYQHWTYDAAAPIPLFPELFPIADGPDIWNVVSHPHKDDPDNFIERAYGDGWLSTWWDGATWAPDPDEDLYDVPGMQIWAGGTDEVMWEMGEWVWIEHAPTWVPTYFGRSGVMTDFAMGSWDLYNFSSDPPQPAKSFYVQLTYNAGRTAVDFEYELEGATGVWDEFWDPGGWQEPGYNEWIEGPIEEWDWANGEPGYVWEEEPGVWWCGGDIWITEYTWDGAAWIIEYFWTDPGWTIGDEFWMEMMYGDLADFLIEPVKDLGDNWKYARYLLEMPINPRMEFFGIFPSVPIAIDQIVIDTICYVPEPVTIVLLGLGGLALLRRRRR